jgi:hypothetical protein
LSSVSADTMAAIPTDPGNYTLQCAIPANFLTPGDYTVSIAADIPMVAILFEEVDALAFSVTPTNAVGAAVPDQRRGIVRPRLEWQASHARSASRPIKELQP